MREILFRGKRRDNQEWITGALFPTADGDPLICNSIMAGHPIDETATCVACQVDPDTVGQYIGYKDKNGRYIFEGDIIRRCTYVEYIPGSFTINGTNGIWEWIEREEVIGNRYDNPELMR